MSLTSSSNPKPKISCIIYILIRPYLDSSSAISMSSSKISLTFYELFFFLLFHILLILLLFNVICTLRLIWLVYIGHTKLQRTSLVIHLILKSLTVSHSEWLNLIFFFFFFFCSIKKNNYFISINKKEVRRIKSFCYVHNLTKKKKTFQEKTKTICRCERDC